MHFFLLPVDLDLDLSALDPVTLSDARAAIVRWNKILCLAYVFGCGPFAPKCRLTNAHTSHINYCQHCLSM
jgi:hypothetical protein